MLDEKYIVLILLQFSLTYDKNLAISYLKVRKLWLINKD